MESRQPEHKPARARLFVALELPTDARTALAAWAQEALCSEDAWRLLPAQALHVTLAFLGWRDEAAVERISKAALEVVPTSATPHLTPTDVVALPHGRPRVLAVDLADRDGRAAELQTAVAGALAADDLYEPDKRPFRPHVTVARGRRGARSPRKALLRPPIESFAAPDVVLYRSELRSDGARYEALARARTRAVP